MWVACYLPIALDLVKIPKFGIASSFGDEESSSLYCIEGLVEAKDMGEGEALGFAMERNSEFSFYFRTDLALAFFMSPSECGRQGKYGFCDGA